MRLKYLLNRGAAHGYERGPRTNQPGSSPALGRGRHGHRCRGRREPVSSQLAAAPAADAIRPFRVEVPDEQLLDLRLRIAATRWPDRETVTDESRGVQLATIQELARYWATGYDWRKCEAKLNALPQFMTEIDGLDMDHVEGGAIGPGCGHFLPEECPDELTAAILEFWKSTPQTN